jgi:hypothetical protein
MQTELTAIEEYSEHCGEEWGHGLQRLPEYMREGVVRYVLHGIIPGTFLQSVIEGDLFMALRRADSRNAYILHEYGRFFFNHAPSQCFGSRGIIAEWSQMGGMMRTKRDTA